MENAHLPMPCASYRNCTGFNHVCSTPVKYTRGLVLGDGGFRGLECFKVLGDGFYFHRFYFHPSPHAAFGCATNYENRPSLRLESVRVPPDAA